MCVVIFRLVRGPFSKNVMVPEKQHQSLTYGLRENVYTQSKTSRLEASCVYVVYSCNPSIWEAEAGGL